MGEIKIKGYICERCSHKWIGRNNKEQPKVCPRCKSAWWNVPRKNKKRKIKNFHNTKIKKEQFC